VNGTATKMVFIVPGVVFKCTDMVKQLSAKIDDEEDPGEWEQNRQKVCFVVTPFVDYIAWVFDTTHEHFVYTRERASLGP
jgi:hypothetical protein